MTKYVRMLRDIHPYFVGENSPGPILKGMVFEARPVESFFLHSLAPTGGYRISWGGVEYPIYPGDYEIVEFHDVEFEVCDLAFCVGMSMAAGIQAGLEPIHLPGRGRIEVDRWIAPATGVYHITARLCCQEEVLGELWWNGRPVTHLEGMNVHLRYIGEFTPKDRVQFMAFAAGPVTVAGGMYGIRL